MDGARRDLLIPLSPFCNPTYGAEMASHSGGNVVNMLNMQNMPLYLLI